MISEAAQEQATLYALGLLDADEATAFERELDTDVELRALVAELRETAAALAHSAEGNPPEGLRARVMARVAVMAHPPGERAVAEAMPAGSAFDYPEKGKIVAGPSGGGSRAAWLPWALAALLMISCGALVWSREQLRRENDALARKTAAVEVAIAHLHDAPAASPTPAPVAVPETDALRRVAFCPLEPTPEEAARPRAAVIWDAARREGRLRVKNLPPPGAGKDYQLWVAEEGRKETVSAGVLTVNEQGSVQEDFQPVPEGGKDAVVAFAISLERAGGSPKNEGPVLFLGKL